MVVRHGRYLVLLAALGAPISGNAAEGCREHVLQAETLQGVPKGLLTAIGTVESGMDPLAINADGESYHPRSIADAVSLVRQLQQAGAQFIDVGCMQVDLFYHPKAFSRLEEAFEPARNAAYGASLLAGNRATWGSWDSAVAYYHSSDPVKQAEYLRRVWSQYAAVGDKDALVGAVPPGRKTRQQTSLQPRTVTVKLSFMTITRPAVASPSFYGGR